MQRWTVTKYIYSNTVLNYNFEVLVLYLSIFILWHFILPQHYLLEANIRLFTH